MIDGFNCVLIDSLDNVVTTLEYMSKGDIIKAIGLKDNLCATSDVEKGHKVSISNIQIGEDIIKYGKKIGIAVKRISPGDLVHIHNIKSERGKGLKRRTSYD